MKTTQTADGWWALDETINDWRGPCATENEATAMVAAAQHAVSPQTDMAELAKTLLEKQAQVPGATYGGTAKGLTIFLWGDYGTWKSSWACGLPSPYVLSSKSEGEDAALDSFPRLAQWMNSRSKHEVPPFLNVKRPPSFTFSRSEELLEKTADVKQNHKHYGVCTVIVDSLTYIVDMWFNQFLEHKYKTNAGYAKNCDKRGERYIDLADWGLLNNYLRQVRVDLTEAGLNVVFVCHEKKSMKPTKADPTKMITTAISPMLQGQSKVKLPGACQLHIHAVGRSVVENGIVKQQPIYFTSKDRTETSETRHKFFDLFPEGKLMDPEWGDYPTPRALWMKLHEFIYTGT